MLREIVPEEYLTNVINGLFGDEMRRRGECPGNLSFWNPGAEYKAYMFERLVAERENELFDYAYSYTLDVAEPLLKRLGAEAQREAEVTITASSTQSIVHVINLLKFGGIRRLAVLAPSYFSVQNCCRAFGLNYEIIPLEREENGWRLPVERLRAGDFDALWLTSPVFGTGETLSNELLAEVRNLQAEEDLFVVWDESLALPGQELVRRLPVDKQTVFIYSPHKAISVNSAKFSVLVHDRSYFEYITDWTDVFGGALPRSSIGAVRHYLSDNYHDVCAPAYLKFVKGREEDLKRALAPFDFAHVRAQGGGHYRTVFTDLPMPDDETILRLLKDVREKTGYLFYPGVLTGFGANFGLTFRVNLLLDRPALTRGLPSVLAAIAKISKSETPIFEWGRLLLDEYADEDTAFKNILLYRRLRNDLDPERLAEALTAAMRAHEAMRAGIRKDASGKWIVYDTGREIEPIKLETYSADRFETLKAEIMRGFEIPGERFCEVRLVRIENELWLFHRNLHAFYDTLSEWAFLDDVWRAYERPGEPLESDGFFAWARATFEDESGVRGEEGVKFWQERTKRLLSYPRSPRQDRDGSVDYSAETNRYYAEFPMSVDEIAARAKALGVSYQVLFSGAFLRAIAADHQSDRAVAGWTCHGRSSKTRRICAGILRDYDVGVEVGGDAKDYLRRVRADLNLAMRHPYGFSHNLAWQLDDGAEDVAFLNFRSEVKDERFFIPYARGFEGTVGDCSDLFELLVHYNDREGRILSPRIIVRYWQDYYSAARVADFVAKFFAELKALIT